MKKLILTTGLVLGLGSPALAAGPAFEDLDSNNDGSISQEEAVRAESLDFSSADANGDGWLSRAEYGTATGRDDSRPGDPYRGEPETDPLPR